MKRLQAPRRDVVIPLEPPASAPPRGARVVTLAGESMGTTWRVTLVVGASDGVTRLRAAIEAELDGVIAQMSHWQPDSTLSRFNRAAAGSRVRLPDGLFFVLDVARQIAEASDGACDATRGELVDLWGFGPSDAWRDRDFAPPDAGTIAAALRRSGWQRLALDAGDGSACQPGGLRLDLSAIAKGHAVDRVAGRMAAEGIVSHLVEIGGELRGTGIKPDGQPWWVSLETPPDRAGQPLPASVETVIALCGLSVATSGDYHRRFEHEGRIHAHTIDPRTGRPVANDLAAVTVLDRDCIRADAWSTALMVLGDEAGLALASRHGIAARFARREIGYGGHGGGGRRGGYGDGGRPGGHGSSVRLVETVSPAWQAMLA